MSEPSSHGVTQAALQNRYPWYSPRFWHGMRLGDWFGLLREGGFAVHPSRWVMASLITGVACGNSIAAQYQRWRYQQAIDATKITTPPVFILGHWRSGTTLLHELMAFDSQFCYPTTFQCYLPHHCLVSKPVILGLFRWILPNKRPMDNMAAGWDHPQEDEFGLMNLGVDSVYRRMAFPNQPARYLDSLNMTLSEEARTYWESQMMYFARLMTLLHSRRILFKSPTHTGRIEVLKRLFPGAKFIHISRHPDTLIPSTYQLWPSLDQVQSLQWPRHERTETFLWEAYHRMYDGYFGQRGSLDAQSLVEIQYEALIQDPVSVLRGVYSSLGLPGFAEMEGSLQSYWAAQKSYRPNQRTLDPAMATRIRREMGRYFAEFGYQA